MCTDSFKDSIYTAMFRFWGPSLRLIAKRTFSTTTIRLDPILPRILPLQQSTITESHVDEWLSAVRHLRNKNEPRNETEAYLDQVAKPEQFLKNTFEPTADQIAQLELVANRPVPIKDEPVIQNLTNLIMRHGKKAKAQRIVLRALYIVQLKTRKDPVAVLTETLDKLGPLFRTKTVITGNAKNQMIPVPLNERQRNRYAITWILAGAETKRSPNMLVRLADEILSAYEGKSSGYEKKAQMHKAAMQQRAYIKL